MPLLRASALFRAAAHLRRVSACDGAMLPFFAMFTMIDIATPCRYAITPPLPLFRYFAPAPCRDTLSVFFAFSPFRLCAIFAAESCAQRVRSSSNGTCVLRVVLSCLGAVSAALSAVPRRDICHDAHAPHAASLIRSPPRRMPDEAATARHAVRVMSGVMMLMMRQHAQRAYAR